MMVRKRKRKRKRKRNRKKKRMSRRRMAMGKRKRAMMRRRTRMPEEEIMMQAQECLQSSSMDHHRGNKKKLPYLLNKQQILQSQDLPPSLPLKHVSKASKAGKASKPLQSQAPSIAKTMSNLLTISSQVLFELITSPFNNDIISMCSRRS